MAEYTDKAALAEKIANIRIYALPARQCGKELAADLLRTYRDAVLKAISEAPVDDVEFVPRGTWKGAYEYAVHLGCTDKERLEELRQDKIWRYCPFCEQSAKGYHHYCSNCGAKMYDKKGGSDGAI